MNGHHNSYIFNKIMKLQYSEKVVGQARKTRGYLDKKSSGLLSVWQKRYFIIIDNFLSYYADQTLQEVKKSIPVQQIKNIKMIGKFEFELVTKKRIYELKADDENDRDLWVASLNILINYKEWNQANSEKMIQSNTKKDPNIKRQSKNKKLSSRSSSPQLIKASSNTSQGKLLQSVFTAEGFFTFVCLPKLAQSWSKQLIKNKTLLLKEQNGCYFILSCKTLLYSHEDEDFLSNDLIYPYDFNTLYYLEFGKTQVKQICKCSQFKSVQMQPGCIKIKLQSRQITIKIQQKRLQILDIQTITKKLRSASMIGKQYYNSQKIKLKRNIDYYLYKYEIKQLKMKQIIQKQFDKILIQQNNSIKNQFKKNLQNLKRNFKEILNCCNVKSIQNDFKQQFVKQYQQKLYHFTQKSWISYNKTLTCTQIKKIIIILYQFWKLSKQYKNDQRIKHASLAILQVLINRYQTQIINKSNQCFSLSQKDLLDQINLDIKNQDQILSKIDTIFLSNNAYRQFHLDIRFVLFQFLDLPINDKSLQYCLDLFNNTFKYITQLTFKYLDKWRNIQLILGTCNQIQFIKNSLFQEMYNKLTKQYKHMSHKIKKDYINNFQNQINNIQIMLVKKLFVLTFSDIDRNLLNKSYDDLSVHSICHQIVQKLKSFTKINRYVRRNIFQASFQQICYFYYTSIIKFNRFKKQSQINRQYPSQYFSKKISQDIKIIGQYFQSSINNQKIYAHLKDLSLIKDFIICDISQIKKICHNIKRQFGNSFTQTAVKNLLSLRQNGNKLHQNLINQCSQIVKNSADTPQEISLISSCRESFLQNWNNTRSRKSTLTLSLNQFYQNQQAIHTNKHNCSHYKQGFLYRKKITKDMKNIEIKSFFKIKNGQLIQYQDNHKQSQCLNTYDLQNIKKCSLHPQKGFIFFVQFSQVKLQLKAQTLDQAKQWIKNIYQEISSLAVVKDNNSDKSRNSDLNFNSLQKDTAKDQSTMDSYQRNLKEKSLDRSNSNSPKTFKKAKKRQQAKFNPDSPQKNSKIAQKEKKTGDDNCLKCSNGFFF